MSRYTIIFAILSITLGIATVLVVFQLWYTPPEPSHLRDDANVQLGLPDALERDERRQLRSQNAVLYDTETKTILFEQNGFERKPIASITKLMTAMVAIDKTDEWDRQITILPDEYVQGGNLTLHPGETITIHDALAGSLIGSANNTTLALVRELGIPEREFVQEMNRKAIALGLEQTEFTDVTGLDPGNVSTAYETAILTYTAFTQYPEIAHLTAQQEYVFTIGGSGREHTIKNTGNLLHEWGIPAARSKTGYLYEARYCLVVQGSGDYANRIAVILDGPSEVELLADMKKLLQLPIQ